jgi:hypothetical protein
LTWVEHATFDGHDAWFASGFGLVESDLCLWFWDDARVWQRCSGKGTVAAAFARYNRIWPTLRDAERMCDETAGRVVDPRPPQREIREFARRHRGAHGLREAVRFLEGGCVAIA